MRKRQQLLSENGNDFPLSVVVESVRDDMPGSQLDDELMRRFLKTDIKSELLRASFFLDCVDNRDDLRPGLQEGYQGYFILKRVTCPDAPPICHVFEAVIDTSKGLLLNNYIHAQKAFQQEVCGCAFRARGSYFCQQNTRTTVCAHDALLSTLMNLPNAPSELRIRESLHVALTESIGAPEPQLRHMVGVVNDLGVTCKVQDFQQAMPPEDYRGLVYATVESGFPAVVVFTTATERHAVTVVGHTLNSDTWFPEAEFGYGTMGAVAKYHPSYDWVPHWIVNDGNLGMYFCLEASKMRLSLPDDLQNGEVGPAQTALLKAVAVIGVYDEGADIVVRNAEEKVARLLGFITQKLAETGSTPEGDSQGKWLRRLLQTCRDRASPGPILRTLQVGKEQYISHLVEEPDWNNNALGLEERKSLTQRLSDLLPARVWMTEFTLVNLFTANRRKLGEVLYKDSWSRSDDILGSDLLFVRLPGIAWFPAAAHVEETRLTAHTQIMRCLPTSVGQPEY
jgi:hypothetical protein